MKLKYITFAAAALCAAVALQAAEKIVAGPKGGRLLESEPNKAEFFVTADRKVEITFYNAALKPVDAGAQVFTVTAEPGSGKVKLDLEKNRDRIHLQDGIARRRTVSRGGADPRQRRGQAEELPRRSESRNVRRVQKKGVCLHLRGALISKNPPSRLSSPLMNHGSPCIRVLPTFGGTLVLTAPIVIRHGLER